MRPVFHSITATEQFALRSGRAIAASICEMRDAMCNRHKMISRFALCTLSLILLSSASFAAGIEADPAKTYTLAKNRGPWMIMVTTFHTTGSDGETDEGKSPEQAAHDLVIELRQLGMPAYVYEHVPDQERIISTDTLGRESRRKNLRRIKSVCVLCGNYSNINDKLAQDSLAWIKKLKPKSLSEGVYFEPTKGRPSILSGAFLTMNPMLTPAEVQQKQTADPFLVKLNHGERFSLMENRGQYSLVIARFYGKHVMVKASDVDSATDKYFKDLTLDNAAESARELVTVLRGKYDKSETQFNDIDAYIWHDYNESIVTVGSFASPDDASIAQYVKRFGPTVRTFEKTGTSNFQPQHLSVAGFGPKGDQNRLWLFEPNPVAMKVPRVK
ncbi:hypothetical protein [Planctomicrobium sp. SH527]|uniref:hypothetical protein n=1 Tax=Planctomicrobium sp. SH527 TaxID=3448123 RepID=UPI003F5C1409